MTRGSLEQSRLDLDLGLGLGSVFPGALGAFSSRTRLGQQLDQGIWGTARHCTAQDSRPTPSAFAMNAHAGCRLR